MAPRLEEEDEEREEKPQPADHWPPHHQLAPPQVLIFGFIHFYFFTFTFDRLCLFVFHLFDYIDGLITDRVVRYCCQNPNFRNICIQRPLKILSRKLLPAHWLENRDDQFESVEIYDR